MVFSQVELFGYKGPPLIQNRVKRLLNYPGPLQAIEHLTGWDALPSSLNRSATNSIGLSHWKMRVVDFFKLFPEVHRALLVVRSQAHQVGIDWPAAKKLLADNPKVADPNRYSPALVTLRRDDPYDYELSKDHQEYGWRKGYRAKSLKAYPSTFIRTVVKFNDLIAHGALRSALLDAIQ